MAGITPRQKRFCDEYLKDLNATRAWKVVYKSKDSVARADSSDCLTKPNIKAYLKPLMKKVADKAEITTEEMLRKFKTIIDFKIIDLYESFDNNFNMLTFKSFEDIPEEIKPFIQEMKMKEFPSGRRSIEIKLVSKEFAMKMLANYTGGFSDRVDHTTNDESINPPQIVAYDKATQDLIKKTLARKNK